MSTPHPYEHLMGWLGIDATQQLLACQFPTLSQAAPHLMEASAEADNTKPILLYRAWADLGGIPSYVPQVIGDCVSHGHSHGSDLLQAVECCLGLIPATSLHATDSEFIYGMSREVAGILGNQDGSYGAAAVKAMTTVGMVSRAMLGSDGTYDGNRAKAWGRTGPPDSVKQMAGAYKLGAAALVSTWDELVAALGNGNPVTECSNWLPSGQRDGDGFCGQNGSGGHCQLICAVRFDKPGACVMNSWPQDFYSGPTPMEIPQESCWVAQSTIERILAGGDCWALAKSPGFPAQPKGFLSQILKRWAA